MSEKPYLCSTCGKSYRNEKSLKSHAVHCNSQNEVIKEMRTQLSDLTSQITMLKDIVQKFDLVLTSLNAGTSNKHTRTQLGNAAKATTTTAMCTTSASAAGVAPHTTEDRKKEDRKAHGKKVEMNAFGHENYTHLIASASNGFVADTIKHTPCFLDALRSVVRKLFRDDEHRENTTVLYKNDTFYIYNGTIWKRIENKTGVVRKVKQRANNVLQHFLTIDTEAFIKSVGDDKYNQLDDFTYRIDTCDDVPEFEKETDDIVFNELARGADIEPLVPFTCAS